MAASAEIGWQPTAGASYGWRDGILGWRTFINPKESNLSPGLASSLDIALFIRDSGDGSGFPVFYVNGSAPMVGSALGKRGENIGARL